MVTAFGEAQQQIEQNLSVARGRPFDVIDVSVTDAPAELPTRVYKHVGGGGGPIAGCDI